MITFALLGLPLWCELIATAALAVVIAFEAWAARNRPPR